MAAPPAPDRTLPPFVLRTLDGASTRLDNVRGARVALVSFWATWCEACNQELPSLVRLHKRLPARDAAVIAISVGEPRETVAAFVEAHHMGWTQLLDEDFRFSDALGQRRVPATLVLDRGGRVLYAGGALDENALAALRSALQAP